MASGRIVLLNGVGSAGKSSIARALQSLTATPFLHVQMDAFLEMMPEALQDHPDGFSYQIRNVDGQPEVLIHTGFFGERTLRGMRHAVAAMARQGCDLIVDDVLLGDAASEYRKVLPGLETVWIGVHAPLEILEARERARSDRLAGLARWQFDRVHEGVQYHLELDTSLLSPIDCASLIKEKFRL